MLHPSVEVYRWLARYLNHYVIELVMDYAMKNVWEYDVHLLMTSDCDLSKAWKTPQKNPLGFYFYHPQYSKVDELNEEETVEKSTMYVHINYISNSELFHVKESDIPSITRYLQRIPFSLDELDVRIK